MKTYQDNKNLERDDECPPLEDISAYCDDELAPSSKEYLHIKSCEHCLKKLKQIRDISNAISSSLSNPPGSDNIETKCLIAVRLENRSRKFKHGSYGEIFLKVAAVFAIFAAAFLFLVDLRKRRDELESAKLEKKSDNNMNRSKVSNSIQTEKSAPITVVENDKSEKHNALNSFNISDMETASAGNKNAIISQDILFENKRDDKIAVISPEVRHVWTWDKAEKNAPAIEEILTELGLNNKTMTAYKDKSGNIVYSLSISKMNLVKLIKVLHSRGYELLSDSEPQPEGIKFLGASDDIARYKFSINIHQPK